MSNKVRREELYEKYRQQHKIEIPEYSNEFLKRTRKRRKDLNWIKLFLNPFADSEQVEWHHITDVYVVAIPRDLHRVYGGGKRERHREKMIYIVRQIYLDEYKVR